MAIHAGTRSWAKCAAADARAEVTERIATALERLQVDQLAERIENPLCALHNLTVI